MQRIPLISMIVSFLIAAVLSILPLPQLLNWVRPEWFLIVLIYWCLNVPGSIGLTLAWGVGLLNDLLIGGVLGAHAFIFVSVAYLIMRFYHRISVFPWQQKTLIVASFLLCQITFLAILDQMGHHFMGLGFYFTVWISSMLSWSCWGILRQGYPLKNDHNLETITWKQTR